MQYNEFSKTKFCFVYDADIFLTCSMGSLLRIENKNKKILGKKVIFCVCKNLGWENEDDFWNRSTTFAH